MKKIEGWRDKELEEVISLSSIFIRKEEIVYCTLNVRETSPVEEIPAFAYRRLRPWVLFAIQTGAIANKQDGLSSPGNFFPGKNEGY